MKIKVLDLSPIFASLRKKIISETEGLADKIEIIPYDGTVENLEQNWAEIEKQYNVILSKEAYQDFFMRKIPEISTTVLDCGMLDTLVKNNNGVWEVFCFFRIALLEAIGKMAPSLNTHGTVCISGHTSTMYCAVAVANQLGFNHFRIVNNDVVPESEIKNKLLKHFFSMHVNFIQSRDLTLEENSGVLLINTVGPGVQDNLLETLSYLNFIRKGGLVVDLSYASFDTQLTLEAANVRLSALRGFEVIGFSDAKIWQYLFGEKAFNHLKYLKSWCDYIKIQSKV